MRGDFALEMIVAIAARGDQDGAKREINASAQPKCGDDSAELSGLGQRFDDAGSLSVTQAAVMVRDPSSEQFGELRTAELLLLGGERERFGERKFPGELPGEPLGVGAMRGKNQDRPQSFAQGTGDAFGPKSLDAAR